MEDILRVFRLFHQPRRQLARQEKARPRIVPQRLSNKGFALSVMVHPRRIKVIHPGLYGAVHHLLRRLLVDVRFIFFHARQSHAAKAQQWNFFPDRLKIPCFHMISPFYFAPARYTPDLPKPYKGKKSGNSALLSVTPYFLRATLPDIASASSAIPAITR